jgi:glucose/mannose-6-phosphate isomerase
LGQVVYLSVLWAGVTYASAKGSTVMRVESSVRAPRDPHGMLQLIQRFPQMCEEAWGLPAEPAGRIPSPQAIVALGMGGSGIGGDLLRGVLFDEAVGPVIPVKEYRAPAFVGPQTLVIACSYSGDTEETLAAYDEATNRGAPCVAITSGGALLKRAQQRRHPAVVVPTGMPPRAALPYLFLPMLAVLARAGAVRSFDADLREAVDVLRRVVADYTPDRSESPARRLGEALSGRIPVVYSGVPFLEPAAERWKDQFNENGKTAAVWNTFPELNHNETVGWGMDAALAAVLHVIILRDAVEAERLARRVAITRELAFARAGGIDEVRAIGKGKLARLLSTILIGDFVSWCVAVQRGVDPYPVAVIDELKRRLAQP